MHHRASLASYRLVTAFMCLLAGINGQAQTPLSPNSDIVKMIQAGLPESAIVNKINEGAGHWDTSVDAIIALKAAGATDGELTMLTASPNSTAIPTRSAQTANQGRMFMGGVFKRTSSGDPMLQFPSAMPSKFLDGRPTNSAYLVTYNGEPAVLIPSVRLNWGKNIDYGYLATNVLFLKTRIVFDFYESQRFTTHTPNPSTR